MAISPLAAAMPQAPFVDPVTGDIALVWRQFLLQLWRRTGSGPGADSTNPALARALAAETLQRQTADVVLTTAISAEQARAEAAEAALRTALGSEAEIRAAGDLHASDTIRYAFDTVQASVLAEQAARIAADALLVPIAQLCSMWAECNFLFLPGSDPGMGRPWLLDGHLVVGLPPTAIGIEAGTDQWIAEDGSGNWMWG